VPAGSEDGLDLGGSEVVTKGRRAKKKKGTWRSPYMVQFSCESKARQFQLARAALRHRRRIRWSAVEDHGDAGGHDGQTHDHDGAGAQEFGHDTLLSRTSRCFESEHSHEALNEA